MNKYRIHEAAKNHTIAMESVKVWSPQIGFRFFNWCSKRLTRYAFSKSEDTEQDVFLWQ